jgi:hypothetical protein
MSLFAATLSTSLVLLVLGAALLWNGPPVARAAKTFPRSSAASILLFGGGALWFLYQISQLGPADFGDYKVLLLVLFGGAGIGAFFVVRDFLAVRGLALLLLLTARPILDASLALYPPPATRVWLNAFVYLVIVLSLYLGVMPYQLRDFFAWLFAKSARARAFGAAGFVYGLLLAAVAATYYQKF